MTQDSRLYGFINSTFAFFHVSFWMGYMALTVRRGRNMWGHSIDPYPYNSTPPQHDRCSRCCCSRFCHNRLRPFSVKLVPRVPGILTTPQWLRVSYLLRQEVYIPLVQTQAPTPSNTPPSPHWLYDLQDILDELMHFLP